MKSNVDKLIQQLISEKAAKYKNGIYHFTQTSLAYNSNRIEGSKLSHEQNLIQNYLSIPQHDFHCLLKFHVDFESIHPFQDGNGRVGRLLLFKECLNHNIIPFIIDHEHKLFYYRGLHEFYREPGYLMDTCLSAQDKYIAYCRHLVKDFA